MTGSQRDGADWAREELGRTLKRAREVAGLSQAELAARLGLQAAEVARAEAGEVAVDEAYAHAVLKACGLPSDWPSLP